MKTFISVLLLCLGFAAGCIAGHFHGKAETLERFTLVTTEAMRGR